MKTLKSKFLVLVIVMVIMLMMSTVVSANNAIYIDYDNDTTNNAITNNDTNTGNVANTSNNTIANYTANTNTNLPQTGIDDTAIYIMIIFVVSAGFAYKKMRDYRLK